MMLSYLYCGQVSIKITFAKIITIGVSSFWEKITVYICINFLAQSHAAYTVQLVSRVLKYVDHTFSFQSNPEQVNLSSFTFSMQVVTVETPSKSHLWVNESVQILNTKN